jgi:two-component system chemotaxis response regulator CheB
VIALAASAGGVEALTAVVSGLPRDIPAAVLVVLHITPIGPSVLPSIIGRRSDLPTAHASDGQLLEAGNVYVAPPDHHLVVEDGRARVILGPRQNGLRPAADPLFRSVAATYGPRAAGVVLSGALDDGTAGLVAINAAGGLTVVQDPDEAAFPGMPLSAVTYANPDEVVPLQAIPEILSRFAKEVADMATDDDQPADPLAGRHAGEQLSEFTCPECGGTLWLTGDLPLQFRCRVGHAFSSESLTAGKQDALEAALWAAIVALEERADLSRRLLRRYGYARSERQSKRYEAEIEESERGASTLRRLAAELIRPGAGVELTEQIRRNDDEE